MGSSCCDTAVPLTLGIVLRHLSDPLKLPDSVYLRQGSWADPGPRTDSPFRLPPPTLASLNQLPFNSRHVV